MKILLNDCEVGLSGENIFRVPNEEQGVLATRLYGLYELYGINSLIFKMGILLEYGSIQYIVKILE